ncbi:Entericidin EcnA/B family, partial [Moritella viscosa]
MKKHQGIVLLLGLSMLLLQACGQPSPAVNKTETKPEP